jgi:predicted TIM-barrel fold metal-dependent hydrolase
VALKHPGLKIILAHLGHPYEGECLVTIRKHDNVFADVSALHYRPWQLYNSLMLAQEYGVWHKLLFGTDFPFTTVNASIDGIRKLNDMLEGTQLPRLDVSQIEAMIHRDSLQLLGLDC